MAVKVSATHGSNVETHMEANTDTFARRFVNH